MIKITVMINAILITCLKIRDILIKIVVLVEGMGTR